jgi:hypothetical protein
VQFDGVSVGAIGGGEIRVASRSRAVGKRGECINFAHHFCHGRIGDEAWQNTYTVGSHC